MTGFQKVCIGLRERPFSRTERSFRVTLSGRGGKYRTDVALANMRQIRVIRVQKCPVECFGVGLTGGFGGGVGFLEAGPAEGG
jgi:hypothetical protein